MKKLLLILLLLPVFTYAQIITTVAGNGTEGYYGYNIAAVLSEVDYPIGLTTDALGNLYFSDAVNQHVRKINATTGLITTVAGYGGTGYNGDGISATSAELNKPFGTAVDLSGNLYIADGGNNRIRKVDASTGIITTIAGTGTAGYNGDNILAVSAELHSPAGISLDASGNLFIAETQNHRVRKVDASTGIITTIAGNGTGGYNGDNIPANAAELNFPNGVTIDALGNIYINDVNNERIRLVNSTTGIITTIAGTGTGGYNGDNIMATSGEINIPSGIALDAMGNLYLSDYLNYRVRKVDVSTGIITTVAGTGTSGYNGDGILAVSAELYNPQGVALDASGNLFIADDGNQRIRKVNSTTVTPFIAFDKDIINVYPNPTTIELTISASNKITTIAITNLLGQIVYNHEHNTQQVQVNVADLSKGIYFIKVNGSEVRKFVKE